MVDAVTGMEIDRDTQRRVGDVIDSRRVSMFGPNIRSRKRRFKLKVLWFARTRRRMELRYYLDREPSDDVLEMVKEQGFRFSFHNGKIWWAKFTEEKWAFAQSFVPKGVRWERKL